MKAVVVSEFGGPEVLKLVEVERPSLDRKQVLIKVEAASVNFADIKARYGQYHGAGGPPFIPGLDATGRIAEIGEDVTQFQVGQRVIAFPKNGSYAEYIVADENLTFLLPDNIAVDTAAACPIVSFTSYKLLADVARIQQGETVLIHAAAGGIGTTAVQLAKLLGASTVIGTVGSESKQEVAIKCGADFVINYEKENFVQRVNEITNGNGADIILDSVAGDISEKSLNCLAIYGRLVNFGISSGVAANYQSNQLHSSCRSILGFSLGTTRNKRPHLLKETAERVFELLARNKLCIQIGKQYSLDEAVKAHELVEKRQSTGKVILYVN